MHRNEGLKKVYMKRSELVFIGINYIKILNVMILKYVNVLQNTEHFFFREESRMLKSKIYCFERTAVKNVFLDKTNMRLRKCANISMRKRGHLPSGIEINISFIFHWKKYVLFKYTYKVS